MQNGLMSLPYTPFSEQLAPSCWRKASVPGDGIRRERSSRSPAPLSGRARAPRSAPPDRVAGDARKGGETEWQRRRRQLARRRDKKTEHRSGDLRRCGDTLQGKGVRLDGGGKEKRGLAAEEKGMVPRWGGC